MISGSFWEGFGTVLGRFWEAKTSIFVFFFDVFSKHFSNNALEGKKIERNAKKGRPPEVRRRFWVGPAECAVARGRDREGVIEDLGLGF